MAVAFFDMDGTLIDGDTNDLSLRYFIEHGLAKPERYTQLRHYAELFFEGVLDINTFMKFAVEPLVGLSKEKLNLILSDCVKTMILPRVKKGAKEAVAFHKERGDISLIVTSTMDYLVEHIAKGVGIDYIIAAPMERIDGVLTGNQAGLVPFQGDKVVRIKEFLQEHNLNLEGSYAYGDSVNDLPMLLLCENRFAIDPNEKLISHPDFKKLVKKYWI